MSWTRMLATLLVLLSQETLTKGFDCESSPDPIFNGSFVDCSNKNLSSHDLPNLYFEGATTLNISANKLKVLPDNSFQRFGDLKRLICLSCDLNSVDIDALNGLTQLEILDLSRNALRISYFLFPKGFFRHVPQLKKLYIDDNGNSGQSHHNYSDYIDIFDSLPELTHLALDSFSNLVIGKEFTKLTKLRSLKINCKSLNTIANDSLKGFQHSNVKYFELASGNKVYQSEIGLDVFQYLPNISYLSLDSLRLGNQRVLRMMKPLVGRMFDTIKLSTLYSPEFGNFDQKVHDGLISVESMEYLGNICVSNFFWLDSHVFSVESDAFLSKMWQKCLKAFVIQTNELVAADVILFFKLKLLRNIELLSYLTRGDGFINQLIDYRSKDSHEMISLRDFVSESGALDEYSKGGYNLNNRGNQPFFTSHEHNYDFHSKQKVDNQVMHNNDSFDIVHQNRLRKKIKPSEKLGLQSGIGENIIEKRISNLQNQSFSTEIGSSLSLGRILITIPPTCKAFIVDGMHYVDETADFWFTPNALTTLMATNSLETTVLQGKFYGFNNVSTINLQGTKIDIVLDFFDTFPSLKRLVLRKTAIRPKWFQTHCKSLVGTIHTLEYLDIAENALQRLVPDTFRNNTLLKYLCLEKNRFSQIPFDLKLTPNLEVLDLRGNSFVELSDNDRNAIDEHINLVPNFTILLDDNELSCACSVLPFILWLQAHLSHFDHNGNYSCISEHEHITHTANYRDVLVFWRICHGRYFLFQSIIMICALLASYLLIFIVMKNKTQIVSKIMQVAMPGFRVKTREDYATDVCIGYADQDGSFIRDVLLRYLEDRWHLRTFVHQRDLCQDRLLMSNYLKNSWRCLFVITEDFLYNCDIAHNVMKVASFFVGPTNPKRMVVLVAADVQHQIPDYVLQVVDEENIIVIPQLEGPLDYETAEALRTRLM